MNSERLLASVLHETVNSIFGLQNLLKTLQEMMPNDPIITKHLEAGIRSSSNVLEILRKAKIASTTGTDQPKKLDINSIIEDTVALLRYEISVRSISVSFEPVYDDPCITVGYYGQLLQVFTNIFLNAIDAIGQNGSIKVKTGIDKGWVRLEVEDDGCGISAEILDRVFESGFTTKSGANSGLGMAISKEIVENHGGAISYRTKPSGTVCIINLPYASHDHVS